MLIKRTSYIIELFIKSLIFNSIYLSFARYDFPKPSSYSTRKFLNILETSLEAEMHAYIHNWLLQLFSQDYGLAFHIIHIVCVNFIHEWRGLHRKVGSEPLDV